MVKPAGASVNAAIVAVPPAPKAEARGKGSRFALAGLDVRV
jgi:hypothetical protein